MVIGSTRPTTERRIATMLFPSGMVWELWHIAQPGVLNWNFRREDRLWLGWQLPPIRHPPIRQSAMPDSNRGLSICPLSQRHTCRSESLPSVAVLTPSVPLPVSPLIDIQYIGITVILQAKSIDCTEYLAPQGRQGFPSYLRVEKG